MRLRSKRGDPEPPYRDRPTGCCGCRGVRKGPTGLAPEPPAGPRVPGFRSMRPLRRTLPWRGPGRGASAQRRSGIRHARCGLSSRLVTRSALMAVMIGTGPHKGSHTAVAVGVAEEPLGTLRVQACPDQAGKLVAWARAWPERTWAVEGARGLGHLCWPSSWSPPVSACWMCSPSWLPGCGCCTPGTPARTTPTMPCRWRWRRCGLRPGRR
jgi:hypothetical protein